MKELNRHCCAGETMNGRAKGHEQVEGKISCMTGQAAAARGWIQIPSSPMTDQREPLKQRVFFDMQSHQTFPSHRHNIHVVSHWRLFHQVCFQYQAIAATIANIEHIRKQFIELERDVMERILSR